MSCELQVVGPADRLYRFLFNGEDPRACDDIPPEACAAVPRNFFRIGTAETLAKLADELANAKTVLPWLLGAIGASPLWIGFLVPVRESMSMLPQLLIAGLAQSRPRRKEIWLAGALLQGAALAGLVPVAMFLRGAATGAAVLGLLFVFSLARALSSVASKDVVGKTIPKRRRGRLAGFTAAASGVLTLAVGLGLVRWVSADASPTLFAGLLAVAAGLWFVAAGVFARVAEVDGETRPRTNVVRDAFGRLDVLRTDAPFRRFLVVRALLISTALAGPYYVLVARESGGGAESLGLFVLASGLASAVSSAVWGRYADRSSRSVLMVAGGVASGLGILLFALDAAGLLGAGFAWIAPVAYFALAVAHSGVRIGRKTYVLDLGAGSKRTDYVAVGNTTIGLLLLVSGSLGALTPWLGPGGMLLLLSSFGLLGSTLATFLPEVE
jgi:hypothetical protein